MKKCLAVSIFLGVFLSGPLRPAYAGEVTYSGNLVNDTVIGVSTNYDLDLKEMDSISFVATYSTAAPSNKTFTDGQKATATVTVTDYSSLTPLEAWVTIAVTSSPADMANIVVTLNGVRFKEGSNSDWVRNASTATTATNLAAAIDAHADFVASAIGSVVHASAAVAGTFANTWVATSTFNNGDTTAPYFTFSGTTFGNGRDNARLVINDVLFSQGTDFDAETSSITTAYNLSLAIAASDLASELTISTGSTSGIVTLTAVDIGASANAWDLFSSTEAALTTDGFTGGSASKVDLTNDTIAIDGHGFGTGFAVLYTTAGATIGGLTDQTTYYVIKENTGKISLASSKANASAGTAINLTSETGSKTYTLAAIAISGTPSFKWQASNDGTNFVDLAVSSVTFSAAGSTGWDFGAINYRWLRLAFTASTFGGFNLTAAGNGRKD